MPFKDPTISGIRDSLGSKSSEPPVDEPLESEYVVGCGHRIAVRPARIVAQGELDPGTVVRGLDRLAEQAIERERLVDRLDHQGIVDDPHARRVSLEDERVEAVEGAEAGQHQRTALDRFRIGAFFQDHIGLEIITQPGGVAAFLQGGQGSDEPPAEDPGQGGTKRTFLS